MIDLENIQEAATRVSDAVCGKQPNISEGVSADKHPGGNILVCDGEMLQGPVESSLNDSLILSTVWLKIYDTGFWQVQLENRKSWYTSHLFWNDWTGAAAQSEHLQTKVSKTAERKKKKKKFAVEMLPMI